MEEETKEEEENEKVEDESKVKTSIGQPEKKCETLSVSEVVNHMVTVQVGQSFFTAHPTQHLQPTSQDEISGKLRSCVSVLKGDLESITRVGREMVEDGMKQGVKYMEVGTKLQFGLIFKNVRF